MTSATRAQIGRTREILQYADVRIEVIAEGNGPLIVMLPSSGRDSEDFDDVAANIAAAGFRVLRPQPRGVGASVGPMQGISYHDFARDIAAVIEDQGGRPAVMVGHAFGNQVSRMTAVDYPDLVRGVVLAAAAAKGPSPQELRQALGRSADLSLPDSDRLSSLQLAFFAPGHDPSPWLRGWHRETMECQRIAIGNTSQDEWFSAGTAPILDLQAALDPWRPRDRADELKNELGDRVTLAVIPDASHALIPEQPVAVVNEIVAWVGRLSTR
jgi:pimeloyl-ACP methyl ester carboxylesterase